MALFGAEKRSGLCIAWPTTKDFVYKITLTIKYHVFQLALLSMSSGINFSVILPTMIYELCLE